MQNLQSCENWKSYRQTPSFSGWLVFKRPLLAGFQRPLTLEAMTIAKRAIERRLAATLGATYPPAVTTTLGADFRHPNAPALARPLRAEGKTALDGQKSEAQNGVA